MFQRKEVNLEELNKNNLLILPQKIEYDEDSNEIWVFGLTSANQTALIRVNQFNNLFYIIDKDSKVGVVDSQQKISDLLNKQFKKCKFTITSKQVKDDFIYQVIVVSKSLNLADLESTLEKVDLSSSGLFNKAHTFIPKLSDQIMIEHGINSKTFIEIKIDGKINQIQQELPKSKGRGKQKVVSKVSTCQIEVLSTDFKPTISRNPKLFKEISSNQIILITDIENLVLESGFDASKCKKNPIFMISNLIFKNGESACVKQIFTTSDKIELSGSVEVKYFKSELEMLVAWFQELYRFDPDIITGFNVFKFDLSFLYLRTKHLIGVEGSDFSPINFGRVPGKDFDENVVSELFQNKFYFNLKEDIEIFEAYGRQVIDLSWYFNHSQPFVPQHSRKLKDWAKRYLNEDTQKLDIPYNEFADYLNSPDIKKRSLLGEYNIRDSEIVQELILKFDFLAYYGDFSYLNNTLAQNYHDKSFFPVYFKQFSEICQLTSCVDFDNDRLVIKNNQPDQWEKVQSFVSSLSKLQKVEFQIDSETSPLIFKQLVMLQENLKLENISFKIKESVDLLNFKLSPLVQNLHSSYTKALSLSASSEVKDQKIDLIDTMLCLPISLSFLYVQLHETTDILSSKDAIKKAKAIKSNNLNKIVINFNDYQSPDQELAQFLNQLTQSQLNLEGIDLLFKYDSVNDEFIKSMVKSLSQSSKSLKTLNLTIKGDDSLKNSTKKDVNKKSTQLLQTIIKTLEKELLSVEKIFLTFSDIKLDSLDDSIFTTFGKKLKSLELFIFKIDEEKKFLKSGFYGMIKLLKERK